jgi:hypothetical protein
MSTTKATWEQVDGFRASFPSFHVSTPEDSRDREEEPEQGSKSRKGNQVEGECRCLPKTCLRKKKAIQCICLLHEYSMPPLDPL